MTDVCYRISGRVQGVGFRYWTLKQVRSIGGISGYVMNMDNRDVCVYVSAPQEKLSQLEKILHKGPLFARVDNITYSPQDAVYFPKIENGVFTII